MLVVRIKISDVVAVTAGNIEVVNLRFSVSIGFVTFEFEYRFMV
jgi:hypothetical protein